MKLLFDQNISFRIVKKLQGRFKGSGQVRTLGLENSTDLEIWNYAKTHAFTIVTFDTDFYDIANLNGHPPKILWLRMGNSTTQNILNSLLAKQNIIEEFILSKEYSDLACLELNG